jgi:hypothetical protein
MSEILQVRTLREFLESDQVIDCDCSNYWVCSHTGPLRIELAIQRLGWEFDFYAGREILAAHVYCSVCGKRRRTSLALPPQTRRRDNLPSVCCCPTGRQAIDRPGHG